jgi:hypothetical protein
MPANAEFFIIDQVPPETDEKDAHPTYLIRVRDRDGQWRTMPVDMAGILEVRSFLDSHNVDEGRIALAVEELGRNGHTMVIGSLLKAA